MIQLEAKFKKIQNLKTESHLIFSTKNEIDEIELSQLINKVGFLAFNEDEFASNVLKIMKDKKIGRDPIKGSRSEQLRKKVYELWFDHGQKLEPVFDLYYQKWMDHFMDLVDKRSEDYKR